MVERKKKEDGLWNLVPSLVGKLVGSVEDIAKYFLQAAETTAEDLLRRGVEKLVTFFLVAVGTLFLAVGVAALLSEHFHTPGAGPLIVGASFLIVGLFFDLSRRK